jgi:tetratricopeptide (TPR) repeat protein
MKEAFRLMALTEQVDAEMTPIAKTVFPEYIAVETDPVKRDEAKIILADLYRVAGDSENAILAYRQVLETAPDNIDAMAGLGFSLVNMGYVNNDKAQLQEGANFLQKFATAAPGTHKYKDDAVGLIETLKKEQNVAPVKSAAAKKKN